MTTGQLDRIITVERWTATQDAGGGNTRSLSSQWNLWAMVENGSASNTNTQEQRAWEYDVKITVQYDSLRPVLSNDTVMYESVRYEIKSVTTDTQGKKDWQVLRCNKTGR